MRTAPLPDRASLQTPHDSTPILKRSAKPIATMEAIAAIALAGNVLHFVQVGLKILSKGNNLKRSRDGKFKEHSDIDEVLKDLDLRLANLQSSPSAQRTSPDHESLQGLASRCQTAGQELRDALLTVKSKGKGIFSTYRMALSAVWNKSTMEEAEKNLERLRDEMQFHLQTVMQKDTKQLLIRCASTDQAVASLQQIAEGTRQAIVDGFADHNVDNCALFAELAMIRALYNQLLDLYKSIRVQRADRHAHSRKPDREEFLETLRFSSMEDRKEAVPKAHMQTYQWLLMDPKKEVSKGSEDLAYNEERAVVKNSLISSFQKFGIDIHQDDPFSLNELDQCPSEHLQDWLQSGEHIL